MSSTPIPPCVDDAGETHDNHDLEDARVCRVCLYRQAPAATAHRDVVRALVAELHRLPGGHAIPRRDLERLSREGGRLLLHAIRHLKSERDDERRKRRQGRFF